MNVIIAHRLTLSLIVLCLGGGCSTYQDPNPSFPITIEQGRAALDEMATRPRTLERPVLVLGGWAGFGSGTHGVGKMLSKAVGDDRVYAVPFVMHCSMGQCRNTVLKKLAEVAPSDDPTQTIEVDVVGLSMGMLIARYAAMPVQEGEDRPRLRIKRLYSIAGPYRGAAFATIPIPPTPLNIAMMPNSAFIRGLDVELPYVDFKIYNYVRLGDGVTGVVNAAPPGQVAWWVPNPPWGDAHVGALKDPRIIADIARRLRGETPYATEPPAPLPEN